MFYQPILWKEKPYNVAIGSCVPFPLHLHHEIEILYCLKNSIEITLDGHLCTVNENEFIIIGSMTAHEIINANNSVSLLVELGPVFLRENFKALTKYNFYKTPYSLTTVAPYAKNLENLFLETYNECANPSEVSDLIIQGNIYKICACLIRDIPKNKKNENKNKKDTAAIQEVLEMVYYHYNEPITVDDAAKLCGYGKSNFCKIFKNAVGESFHSYLNAFRIKNAGFLLRETKMSVEEIALASGFNDSKTFCRVFKSYTSSTPGQYRKTNDDLTL